MLIFKKGEKRKVAVPPFLWFIIMLLKKNIIMVYSQFIVNLIRPVLHWPLSGIDAN